MITMKPIVFHPKARETIRQFPKEVLDLLGKGLFRLQMGESIGMPHSRPMSSVGPGVSELRVKGEDNIYRAFYYVGSRKGILVFHAFRKKTQKPAPFEIEFARKRLRELLHA
jgi:phage-related protein